MTRINTNVAALQAGRNLGSAQASLQTSLERLSTGLRINRGADDPAGLIISENLRSEIESVRQAVSNSQRASNVIATTEGALDEVAALLNDIQGLILEASNSGAVSDEEIRANQLQIDSAIESITRIANTTTFGGRKLLNGSLGYVASGVVPTELTDLRVQNVQFGTAPFIPVEVNVLQSAQHAELRFLNSSIGEDVTLEIAGPDGVISISLLSGSSADQIRAAINLQGDSSGVSASFVNSANPASGIVLNTREFGSDAFVQIQEIGTTTEPFLSFTENINGDQVKRAEGRDISATVNGASGLGDGLNLALNTSTLGLQFKVQETFNQVGTSTFAITGGGARFQLGPSVETNQQVNIGVDSVAATRLGNDTIGFLQEISSDQQFSLVNGEFGQASRIIDQAIEQVSILRGRLGSFEKNTLETNINQLQITLENLTSSESSIRDLDFAQETAALTRNQILVSAGTSVLALANQTPQTVLSLLQ